MAINLRTVVNAVRTGLRILQKAGAVPPSGTRRQPPVPPIRRPAPRAGTAQSGPQQSGAAGYPGDFRGRSTVQYSPAPDGDPDPGEVVWAWVPYEEDYSRGKDRPVLLVGNSGAYLLGLMLTSKDHVPASRSDGAYIDLGAGPWDTQGRPSEALLDRVLQIRPDAIRREGAVLDRARFEKVAAGLRKRHGWT
ncbi:hypothetical protein ACU18_06360 [Arthrobacter sp. ZBG10]|uniref:type II toxin-antitoxin system PemK/MazF family toxin n=1 Tax=Arthrobacter sp. ZBG10 TaxID=1676590 RepID=UPI000680A1E8|nr:type II toxin-antitoxin system PemK/MazF family toxin [Arthrobacter sp. ZBG10]KNH18963.1 hypothetical protein ACU18_06360 [Arthrobacter sp. ZBG10]